MSLSGVIISWALVQKYQIKTGFLKDTIDNLTVVSQRNDGIDLEAGHGTHLSTDYNVWRETGRILELLPINTWLHVKGHQDGMHIKGIQGHLTWDAQWKCPNGPPGSRSMTPYTNKYHISFPINAGDNAPLRETNILKITLQWERIDSQTTIVDARWDVGARQISSTTWDAEF